MTATDDATTASTTPPGPPGELGTPATRWPVFIASMAGVLAIALWAIIAPDNAAEVITELTGKVTGAFGWFYILLTTVVLVFVIYLGLSRFGHIRLGPDHSRPEFSTFAWASMLFAAGIGTDVMFYSVVEPVSQYVAPPVGDGETVVAAREATVWTMFHYGISGWGLYVLMGLALAFFAYRRHLPLAVRSALQPLFGKRVDGVLGHAVDTATVLGTIFGVATSLGIGVVFLNIGLNMLFDVSVGTGTQIALVVLAVAMATVSATTGVDKGIRFLSQLNVLLALGLAAWVLFTGRTQFLLESVVMNVGDYAQTFAARTMETFAFSDAAEWESYWTLFFWAWWVAWASFVGLFLARISRGRTIRQFVLGALTIPFAYIVMWVCLFGNAALDRVRSGDADFAAAAQEFDGRGFFELLEGYPGAQVTVFLALVIGLLFYVTSADSGALVMGNLCSVLRDVQQDCAAWQRIVWASATGLLTIAMLAVGGIGTLQYATIIMGLPFAFVIVLVMIGLAKALRVDDLQPNGVGPSGAVAAPTLSVVDDSKEAWRARIARATNFVDVEDATAYLHKVVEPALREVAAELSNRGVPAEVAVGVGAEPDGDREPAEYVEIHTAGEQPFVYRVQVHRSPVPTYGGRMISDRDQYARLEVHGPTGGLGYDVMGCRASQVIHDCLDRYERHLEFLRQS
ncbi:choline BCCT transporter BetT [Nocardioides sambongensis]|uniref:choline BCCT transporter BetT n=1 Tax=Nocardioides sambongensis TaxID=2589074 RepID=UPI001126BF29|nr:choline BCCT transporter BetT [Nocardioides sambongensis]